MQPKLSLLDDALIGRILEEAYQLMLKPGIKVQNARSETPARRSRSPSGRRHNGRPYP